MLSIRCVSSIASERVVTNIIDEVTFVVASISSSYRNYCCHNIPRHQIHNNYNISLLQCLARTNMPRKNCSLLSFHLKKLILISTSSRSIALRTETSSISLASHVTDAVYVALSLSLALPSLCFLRFVRSLSQRHMHVVASSRSNVCYLFRPSPKRSIILLLLMCLIIAS